MRSSLLAAVFFVGASPALACNSVETVMAHFERVKDAYLVKAPEMKPEDFPVWSSHLERFGDAMGTQNFQGACQALDDAAMQLGFDVAAAPTSVIANDSATAESASDAGAPSVPSAEGTVSIGSGVQVGSGVTVGSGSEPLASAPTRPQRTRARPDRIKIR